MVPAGVSDGVMAVASSSAACCFGKGSGLSGLYAAAVIF